MVLDLVRRLVYSLRVEVAISEFKAKCIEMLKTTARTGEELVVTLRGEPLARVVGVRKNPQRILGGQKGTVDASVADRVLMDSDLETDWE